MARETIKSHAEAIRKAKSETDCRKDIRFLLDKGTPASIKALIENGLKHKNIGIAIPVAERLGRFTDTQVIKALGGYGLRHKQPRVVDASLNALWNIRDPASLPYLKKRVGKYKGGLYQHNHRYVEGKLNGLIRELEMQQQHKTKLGLHIEGVEKSYDGKRHVEALEEIGTPKAIDALIDVGLAHKNNSRHVESHWALTKLGEKAIPHLVERIKEKKHVLSCTSVLNEIQRKEGTKEFIKYGLLNDDHGAIFNSLTSYDTIKPTKAVVDATINHALKKCFDWEGSKYSERFKVQYRMRVFGALKNFKKDKSKRVIKILLDQGLKTKDEDFKEWAIEKLGKSKDKSSVPALIEELEKNDNATFHKTTSALGQIGGEEALEALRIYGVRKSKDTHALWAARWLARNHYTKAVPDIIKYIVKKEPNRIVGGIIKVLKDMDTKESVRAIIKYGLTSKDRRIKAESIAAVRELRTKEAVPALTKLLKTQDKDSMISVIDALGKIGDKKAVNVLKKYGLTHDDTWIIYQTLNALKIRGQKESVPHILRILNNEDNRTKTQVIKELGEIGDKEALPHLMKLVGTDKMITKATKEAIKQIQEAQRGIKR